MKNIYSTQPSDECIEEFVKKYNKEDEFASKNYNAVLKVVSAYHSNDNYENIYLKTHLINSTFHTGILDTDGFARQIHSTVKNIDARLKKGDYNIINELGNYINGETKKTFYSFATKFCHFHYPDKYCIYDRNVKNSLIQFSKEQASRFSRFSQESLKDYQYFFAVMEKFKAAFDITVSTAKLDRFLWSLGKEFNKKKSKKK